MEKRKLGRTGEELSILGFGGICVTDVDSSDAQRMVGQAFDAGVNYFDVAPSYGNAEERLGPALKPYRDGVFLACKTGERTAAGAQAELENSLRLLKTDRLDLYQFHAVTTLEDVDAIFAPGGATETFLRAREKGDIRYIGFSAHSQEAAIAMLERFDFDSMMFPVNWAAWLANDFGPAALKKAREKGAGIVAIKALARRALAAGEKNAWEKEWYVPAESFEEARMGLRFTLTQPVTAAMSPGHWELFQWALEAANNFEPLSNDEIEELREKAETVTPLFPVKA